MGKVRWCKAVDSFFHHYNLSLSTKRLTISGPRLRGDSFSFFRLTTAIIIQIVIRRGVRRGGGRGGGIS